MFTFSSTRWRLVTRLSSSSINCTNSGRAPSLSWSQPSSLPTRQISSGPDKWPKKVGLSTCTYYQLINCFFPEIQLKHNNVSSTDVARKQFTSMRGKLGNIGGFALILVARASIPKPTIHSPISEHLSENFTDFTTSFNFFTRLIFSQTNSFFTQKFSEELFKSLSHIF